MLTFRRLMSVVPLVFLFSLLVIHVTAQPINTTIQLETGSSVACGIRLNGTLQCWGQNNYGQSTVPNDLGTVKAVSVDSWHTCAIKSDDTLRCWGKNDAGQSTVPLDLGTVKSVATAWGPYTCAIKTDDTLRCWGENDDLETTIPPDLGTVKAVSLQHLFACAIKSDDTVSCWGRNDLGQSTVPFALDNVKVVTTGWGGHTCAIKSDDTLRCWGNDNDVQSTFPLDLGSVKSVSLGYVHVCAIKIDDTVRCWGNNNFGQTTLPPNLGTVKSLSVGGYHTCAIKSDDTVSCWGFNNAGQINVPLNLGTVKALSLGEWYSCAVKSDDTPICWGSNQFGQTTVPQPSVSLQSSTSIVSEGESTTIKVNASDYAWTNVIVSLTYGGNAIGTGDYNAPSAVFMTTSDLFTNLVITTTDDSQIETDETIILDITSVTGGMENGTQQLALVIQDDDEPTVEATSTSDSPTSTPTLDAPDGNLLVNDGFEAGLAPWLVKAGLGDKVKCNKDGKPPVAKSGTCAFQFKSGAGERTKIEQTLETQTWKAGDMLQLSLYVKATNAAASGKVKVSVKYSDGTATGKINANIVQKSDYTEVTGEYTLLSANVSKVKLSIQNRSAAGKVLVDDVMLLKGGVVRLLALP